MVQQLARKGATVYLGARDKIKANSALARLEAEGLAPGNGKVHWLDLDLSHPRNAVDSVVELEDMWGKNTNQTIWC